MPARPRRPLLASALALLLTAGSAAAVETAPVAPVEPAFRSAPGPAVGNVLTTSVARVDGDDVPDLVSGVVGVGFLVELGRGDGTFRAPRTYAVPNAGYGVAVGDVDRDGDTDVVALSNAAQPVAVTFLGTGDELGTLRQHGRSTPVAASGYAPLLADLDEDGLLDLAVPAGGRVHVHDGLALADATSGWFAATPLTTDVPAATSVFAPAAGDLDGDGRQDLVLPSNNGRVTLLLGSPTAAAGTTAFLAPVVPGAVSAFDVAVGDLDGQGGVEVAYAGGTRVGLLAWTTGRTFADRALSSSTAPVTAAAGVSVADFDGDGRRDVAVGSDSDRVKLFLAGDPAVQGGPRTFRLSTTVPTVDRASHAQVSADVDVDGTPDVVLTSPGSRRSVALVNTTGPGEVRAPALGLHPAATTVVDGGTLTLTAASSGTVDTAVRWERRLTGAESWTELVEGEASELRDGSGLAASWTGRVEGAVHGARYRAVFRGRAEGARAAVTDEAVVTVAPPAAPEFTSLPQSVRVREGSDAVFSLGATGAPSPSVAWAVAAPGSDTFTPLTATGRSLTLPAVAADRDGSRYRATLSNSEGLVSATVVLSVDPLPVLVTPPASTAVRPGDTARFSLLAEDADLRWQASTDLGRTWGTLAPTTSVLELPGVTASQNGTRVRAQLRSRGTSTPVLVVSPVVVLTVDAAPAAPTGLSAVESAPGRLTVRWGGSPSTDVTGWTVVVDGDDADHAATVREAVVSGLAPGTHRVEVCAVDAVGRGGCARSSVLTVGTAPAGSPSASPSGSGSPATTTSARPSATATATTSPTPSPSASPSHSPSPSVTASPSPSAAASPSASSARPPGPAPDTTTPDGPDLPPAPVDRGDEDPDLQPSELSVVVADELITAGGASQLAGTAAPGSVVELVAYVRPSTRYAVLRSTVADDEGHFTFTVRPSGNMRAFVRTADDVVSPSVVQQVRAAVSLAVTRRSARGFRLAGTVTPKAAGQLVSVFEVSGTSRRLVTQTRTDARGAYRRDHTFAAGRTHALVATVGRTTASEPGTSPRRFAAARR